MISMICKGRELVLLNLFGVNTLQTLPYLSFNSTSWIFVLRSDASDVGVGGYSIDKSLPGRLIRNMHGNQYRNKILT